MYEITVVTEAEIERHPFLELPPELREERRALRDDFINKLLVCLYPRVAMGTEDVVIEEGDEERKTSEQEHLGKMQNLLMSSSGGMRVFDEITFMESFATAVRGYEKDRGSFLHYFRAIYSRSIRPNAANITRTMGKKDDEVYGLIRMIKSYLEMQGVFSFDKLSEEKIREIADALGRDRRAIVAAWRFYVDANNPVSLDKPLDDDPEVTLGQYVETDFDAFAAADDLMGFTQFMRKYCSFEEREYPRLFLSTDILHVCREKQSTDMIRVVQRDETFYLHEVFLRDYLEFVLVQPPEPDTVYNILRARASYPFQDKTIAAYKGVSRPAISAQRKKYEKLINARRALHRQENET